MNARKLFYLFIAAAILISCQNKKEYAIEGAVPNADFEGSRVYLQQMTDDAMITTDTAVVKNGRFSFSGAADTVRLRFILLDESVDARQETRIPVLLERGKLKVTFDSVVTVKGTKINEAYTDFRLQQRNLGKKIREVVERYNRAQASGTLTESMDAEINESYDSINNQMSDLNFNFIKENIGNELGKYSFMVSSAMFEPEQQKEILALADEDFKARENIQRVVKRLENLEKVAIGQQFADFTLTNPEGKEVSLSDYAGKGKYLLIDFWAAWCGPCRQENPNVVKVYKEFNKKGFDVFGVSLDRTKEDWLKAIADDNLTWTHVSDLQYWNNAAARQYAVNAIPANFLLDENGIILGRNLRDKALYNKVKEVLGN